MFLDISRDSFAVANIAEPSIGILLVIIIESFFIAPDDRTSLPLSTSPSIPPIITGVLTEFVISVCPPTSFISNSLQASINCEKIVSTSFLLVLLGNNRFAIIHLGIPPVAAISFAFTFTAYHPI